MRWRNRLKCDGEIGCFYSSANTCPIPASSGKTVRHRLNRGGDRQANRALMRPHEIRRPEDASELVAARRAAKVSQVRAASILGTSEKYISMLERGQRELKPIRRAYEAWVEAGLPLDWDRQAFEAERKMDSKKHLAK